MAKAHKLRSKTYFNPLVTLGRLSRVTVPVVHNLA